jgi:UDP-N-acetylmuramate: L-alanyl-gamma-D-glutamyl-meso-diaminopimelate ligase
MNTVLDNLCLEGSAGAESGVTLPAPGSDIYLMGICGTGMAALAGLLQGKGYTVRGSDGKTYPPMSHLLERLGIPVAEGYSQTHLSPAPDMVIIGNVIRADNPEALYVQSKSIPYLSFPQALSQLCLGDRSALVVAGTHGKTTTSTLLVSALRGAGEEPGFMVGGVLRDFDTGFRLGARPWFVLEGDEYDTAFFDKRPKFVHYKPHGVILTSLEFDHADIYADLDAVKRAFSGLVALIPPEGLLVACVDWPDVMEVCSGARCRVITYGESSGSMWQMGACPTDASGSRFEILRAGKPWRTVSLPLPGRHNALNALAVIALCTHLGIDEKGFRQGLATCGGVKRRQEVRGDVAGVTVIDDFAHHPTAVRETLRALREQFAGRRLIAVFEPRTNTSRRSVFQEVYPHCFSAADRVLIREVPDPEKAPPGDRFSSRKLVDDLRRAGADAAYFPDADAILEDLKRACRRGDVVAVLSNGGFENLIQRLLLALGEVSR